MSILKKHRDIKMANKTEIPLTLRQRSDLLKKQAEILELEAEALITQSNAMTSQSKALIAESKVMYAKADELIMQAHMEDHIAEKAASALALVTIAAPTPFDCEVGDQEEKHMRREYEFVETERKEIEKREQYLAEFTDSVARKNEQERVEREERRARATHIEEGRKKRSELHIREFTRMRQEHERKLQMEKDEEMAKELSKQLLEAHIQDTVTGAANMAANAFLDKSERVPELVSGANEEKELAEAIAAIAKFEFEEGKIQDEELERAKQNSQIAERMQNIMRDNYDLTPGAQNITVRGAFIMLMYEMFDELNSLYKDNKCEICNHHPTWRRMMRKEDTCPECFNRCPKCNRAREISKQIFGLTANFVKEVV